MRCECGLAVQADLADDDVLCDGALEVVFGDGGYRGGDVWVGAVAPEDGGVVAACGGTGFGGAAGHGEDDGAVECSDLVIGDVGCDVGVAVQWWQVRW